MSRRCRSAMGVTLLSKGSEQAENYESLSHLINRCTIYKPVSHKYDLFLSVRSTSRSLGLSAVAVVSQQVH